MNPECFNLRKMYFGMLFIGKYKIFVFQIKNSMFIENMLGERLSRRVDCRSPFYRCEYATFVHEFTDSTINHLCVAIVIIYAIWVGLGLPGIPAGYVTNQHYLHIDPAITALSTTARTVHMLIDKLKDSTLLDFYMDSTSRNGGHLSHFMENSIVPVTVRLNGDSVVWSVIKLNNGIPKYYRNSVSKFSEKNLIEN
ncbi:hypothetical protein AGLY_017809 [Aphis glycines]|uniref:Uncharacterized protein n=1 Tax=Aphis glycines TaxID=307491 RepID=A0A6G0STT2_APHGL|nr:hypothetical protein AGLY_017809 [Aphis glycines]